jgi:hypothetical protein
VLSRSGASPTGNSSSLLSQSLALDNRCQCVRNGLESVAINGAKVAVSENINKFNLNLLLTPLVQTYRHHGSAIRHDTRGGLQTCFTTTCEPIS